MDTSTSIQMAGSVWARTRTPSFAIPVIGLAKSAFRMATHAIAVRRGTSVRPVFVTAAGMRATDAAALVQNMAGRFRIPDALRRDGTPPRTGPPTLTQARHLPLTPDH